VPSAASTILMPIDTLDADIHEERNSVGQSDTVVVVEPAAAAANAALLFESSVL
jgi:hypothetical protein